MHRLDLTRVVIFVLAVCAAVLLIAPMVFAQGPSQEELRGWLDSPVVLYVLMLLGSLASALKQWSVARMSGSKLTLTTYMSYLQEGVTTIIVNTLSFAALIYADQLNFVSAIGIGYMTNSLSDLLPTGTRSDAVANHKE